MIAGFPGRARHRLSGFLGYLAPREMVPFVARDRAILEKEYRIKTHCYSGSRGGLADIAPIFWGVLTTSFNFSWFAYRQAYWAVLFSKWLGRKSVVVLGGFDVCEEEDANLPARMKDLQYIFRNADCLLSVSNRVRGKAINLSAKPQAVSIVYHGFDSETFKPAGLKQNQAITVAYISKASVERKGLRVFAEAARLLPSVEFVLVGRDMDHSADLLRNVSPGNVRFAGSLPESSLIQELQRSRVYVQASQHEGFGCSLAEAMLCECVPVVSDRGAIPEVVGETGIYIDPSNPTSIAGGISEALDRPELGKAARDRVAALFPLERRHREIIQSVSRILAATDRR